LQSGEVEVRIAAQDPGWFLSVYGKNKIELFDTVQMVKIVVCCEVQISNHPASAEVVGRLEAYRSGECPGFCFG